MIGSLDGRIEAKGGDRVVLAVGGVGYDVLAPVGTIAKLPGTGERARLFTRLVVRDDALVLFGFATTEERALFDLLVTVNGVGSKAALAVLSVLSPDAFRRAVAAGDAAALTMVPGVGRKLADRVLMELKDRLGGAAEPAAGPLVDVREALLALGLSLQEAHDAIAGLSANGDSVEELLKEALQRMGRA